MRKILARIALLCICAVYCLPLTAMAAGQGATPSKPYEKVVAKSGSWYENRMNYDGKSDLVVGYTGNYEVLAEDSALEFSLSEKTLLTGVYIPYEGATVGDIELIIEASEGNMYHGFLTEQLLSGGIGEGGELLRMTEEPNSLYTFAPESGRMVLPKGSYILYPVGDALPVDAFLIKGYNYAAYLKYEQELTERAAEDEGEKYDQPYTAFGNEELSGLYEQFIGGEESELWQAPEWGVMPSELLAPMLSLDDAYMVDEIILSTWNGGQGVHPGIIYILDETGQEIASYRAQGGSQGGVPNALWVATPGITLPAGVYYLDVDAPEALDYDDSGSPAFYVGLSIPAAPPTNFTGTYKIWLDTYKTHTLMGPVNEKKSSFSLEDYELSILDKGSYIELMGQYEGMPFSQNCEVTHREENKVVATFNFAADLTKLPYKAKIAANAKITLTKEINDRITIGMSGQGFYSRAATKEKGADENTYELTVRGNRVKKDLPPFVMAAIAKAYGAGNIPGPDTPLEAAVGMLFPPLVGLVVSVLQGLLKPKELTSKLSVGEQAMKDANQSLGKGLYSEEEAKAWATLADALGASGGDPEDSISIGDNERPGGADYKAPQQSGESFETEHAYPEEDLSFGKPDVPQEPVHQTPSEQQEQAQTAAAMPVEPESMVVQTTARGAETLIVRDPTTGGWVNAETGNPFDLEAHQRNFPQQAKEFEDFIKRNEELEKTGQTAMQQALDEIEKKHQQELSAIQKEIDKRRMEQLRQNQQSLEWEQEQAQKLSGWGRIAGDWVVGMGNDVRDLAKAGKNAVVRTGEGLGTAAGTLVYDPESVSKGIKDAYNSAKKSLGSAKDKVVGKAEEIWNKPWIAVEGVMETGKAALEFATNPKKQWGVAKEMLGISDFGASLDPNLPITERVEKVLSGTFKLGTTIGTGGMGGAAKTAATGVKTAATAGKAATTVGRVTTTGTKAATTGVKAATTGVKAATTGVKAATTGAKTATTVGKAATGAKTAQAAPKYVVSGKIPEIKGMTKTSQRQIQKVAQEELVHIKIRPTTPKASELIDSGKAVAKEMDLKPKTCNWADGFIGGPKDAEGAVGFFRPAKPSATTLQGLSPKQQTEVLERYTDRLKEYQKYGKEIDSMSDKYQVIDKKVYQKVTTTVQEGGKTTKKQVLKMVTGDNDIAEITDVMGNPISEARKQQIMNKLQGVPEANVKHQDLAAWKPGDYAYNPEAKAKMVKDTMEGGKGVVSFNPYGNPTHEFLTGA
ncbi:MAG: hypothetical protein AAGU12_12155 [Clostridiales bacterium]